MTDSQTFIDTRGLELLVVDDDPVLLEHMELRLVRLGCRVVVAGTAEEAFTTVRQKMPSAIVSDLWLPGKDGLWLLERTRSVAPQCARVLISGHDLPSGTPVGSPDVVQRFFTKPLDLVKMIAAIRSIRGGGHRPPHVGQVQDSAGGGVAYRREVVRC